MKVLLYLFRARAGPAGVLLQDCLVLARVRESEIQRAGQRLPHLAAQSVGQTYLHKPSTCWVAHEGEITAVVCIIICEQLSQSPRGYAHF